MSRLRRASIIESTQSLSGPTAGALIDLVDQFDTRNTFHGADAGLVMQWYPNSCWSWEVVAKVAIGGTDRQAAVTGQTVSTTTAGEVATTAAGLLAQPTNIGSYGWNDFGTVSEFGISMRRKLHCGLVATFGYSLVSWSSVARAGEQIDLGVNTSQIPPGSLDGEARPAFPFVTSDFWVQGLHFGLEYLF